MTHNEPGPWTDPSASTPSAPPSSDSLSPGASPSAPSSELPPSIAPSAAGPDLAAPPAPPAGTQPRQRRMWPAVVGSAAAAALVASVATAGIVNGRADDQPAGGPGASVSQVESNEPAAPETPSITGQTAWQDVVDQVAASVVAITVDGPRGGAQGSGVIIDSAGLVLTNNHVIESGQRGSIDVVLDDGRVFAAEIVGLDETTDLGVLRLTDPPGDLVAAELGDSDSLRVGQPVMAVGNPLGLAGTVTTGIVSALDRPTVTAGTTEAVVTNAIQVDAAVNPGNSGGPLFDAAGRVIGINSSIATLSSGSRSGSIGLGFAIPINLAEQVAEQLIATGDVRHAFLGVTLADGTVDVDGVERQGAAVGQVVAGSPAAAAGIETGDVITMIDGKPVASGQSLTGYVRARVVGQVATITLVRDGEVLELQVTLAARDETAQLRG